MIDIAAHGNSWNRGKFLTELIYRYACGYNCLLGEILSANIRGARVIDNCRRQPCRLESA